MQEVSKEIIVKKCKFFDALYKECFERNFASLSKSDMELLLFREYINFCGDNDDYSLSRALGITQAKIRNLKERLNLRYCTMQDSWKQQLKEALCKAKFDESDCHVKIVIQDVNVMAETRHLIESIEWYDDVSLNKKLLNIPAGCFFALVDKLSDGTLELPEEFQKNVQDLYKKIADGDPVKKLSEEEKSLAALSQVLGKIKKSSISVISPVVQSIILGVIKHWMGNF